MSWDVNGLKAHGERTLQSLSAQGFIDWKPDAQPDPEYRAEILALPNDWEGRIARSAYGARLARGLLALFPYPSPEELDLQQRIRDAMLQFEGEKLTTELEGAIKQAMHRVVREWMDDHELELEWHGLV